jgi:hypothetical protein
MIIKPPLFVVLAFLGGLVLSIYNTYRILVSPQRVKRESLNWTSKLPKWNPLRKSITKRYRKSISSGEVIFMVFITLIMLGATVFLFIALFIRQ